MTIEVDHCCKRGRDDESFHRGGIFSHGTKDSDSSLDGRLKYFILRVIGVIEVRTGSVDDSIKWRIRLKSVIEGTLFDEIVDDNK